VVGRRFPLEGPDVRVPPDEHGFLYRRWKHIVGILRHEGQPGRDLPPAQVG
jgi:hypothetical protein